MADIRLDRTWAGAGIKVGGFLFVVGATSFEGAAFRLDGPPSASVMEVNVSELQMGLGLGGGFNFSFFFAFNVGTLWEINNMTSSVSPTFGISVPDANIGAGSYAVNVLQGLDTIGKAQIAALDAKAVQDISNCAQLAYSGWQAGSGAGSNASSWVVVDIPVGGWGAQAMAGGSAGQFSTLG